MVQETGTRGGKEEEEGAGGANSTTSGGEHMHQPDHVLPGTRNGACHDLSHRTVLAPIYHTERCFLRSTSRANAFTIQNFPTSVQELSSELTVLTFKLSNQVTLQQPVCLLYTSDAADE